MRVVPILSSNLEQIFSKIRQIIYIIIFRIEIKERKGSRNE